MEIMEDKSIFVYNYVDLKNRELVRKHVKRRHLGDVDGKYRYHAPQQTQSLMGSLISLDFPETRAINNKSANAIIHDQSQQIRSTYQKTFRTATLDAWSRPQSSMEDRPYSSLDDRPQTAPGDSLDFQPQNEQRVNRPHTTGSRGYRTPSRKPPHPSGFMYVKMKPDGSVKNVSLRSVTEEIRDWWDKDDKKQREKARKAHSQNLKRYDSFAGQWLSFMGNAEESEGGVVEAFTGKNATDEFYNIESKVGASVAMQLKTGNKVRVGVNGTLQSDSLRVKKWKNEPPSSKNETVEDIFREAKSQAPDVVPYSKETEGKIRKKSLEDLVPLSWSEQVSKPNVKVVGPKEPHSPPPKPDLSERHPVVFHPLAREGSRPQNSVKLTKYRINQQTKSKMGIDGTESLNNRITCITVDQVNRTDGGTEEMTDQDYENLLKERMKSFSVDDVGEDATEEGEMNEGRIEEVIQVTPHRKWEDMKESSLHSLGRDSDMSGLTVEKPATVRSQYGSTTDFGVLMMQGSTSEKPNKRQIASARPSLTGPMKMQSSEPHLQGSRRTMARSAGSQRMEADSQRLGTQSPVSQRALSSASSRRRYAFDQPVTPRNAHSPRPNLVKPGHLPRTRVSSISTGPQDGEQEYIKFSQQILRPGDPRSRHGSAGLAAISRVSETNQARLGSGDVRFTMPKQDTASSIDDHESVDSMNVHRGDAQDRLEHYHEDGSKCTCSAEAKRAMSAALSAMSHVSTEHSVINIPTAAMTPTESDARSFSDMDPLSSTSSFRRASLGEEDWKESSFDQSNNNFLDDDMSHGQDTIIGGDQVAESGDHSLVPNAEPSVNDQGVGFPPTKEMLARTSSKEIVINKDDGLDSQGITPPRSAGKKRTVKFSDEVLEPPVPYTSPSSTPREPAHPRSAEDSLNSSLDRGESFNVSNRPDLTASHSDSDKGRVGSASKELTELRAKIKADLQQSQSETQHEIEEMENMRSQNVSR